MESMLADQSLKLTTVAGLSVFTRKLVEWGQPAVALPFCTGKDL
jgi:hypothetical protein